MLAKLGHIKVDLVDMKCSVNLKILSNLDENVLWPIRVLEIKFKDLKLDVYLRIYREKSL